MIWKEATEPLTRIAARKLRALSLAVPEGTLLGSEAELIERVGVSRPTFRQAARLVEHEQLLAIRRGVGGGFHARRPDVSSVVNSAVTYMLTEHTTLRDIFSVSTALTVEAARLACDCSDPALREKTAALLARFVQAEHAAQTWEAFHAEENQMLEMLCSMAGNGALTLLLHVLFRFGTVGFETGVFHGREDLMQVRRSSRLRVLRAILDGDREVATMLLYRDAEQIAAQADAQVIGSIGDISRYISRQPVP